MSNDAASPQPTKLQPPPRRPMHELTRKYIHPTYRVEYEVQAFAVEPRDPDVPAGTPWDPEDGGCRHPDIRFPSRRRRRSVPLDDNDSLGCIVGRISLPDGWFPKGTGGRWQDDSLASILAAPNSFRWKTLYKNFSSGPLTKSKPASHRLMLGYTLGGVCSRCDLIIHF